jgi:signal transduction histidine kinase
MQCDQARFEIEEARSGRAGFELARVNSFDVVLLDYKLPDGNGTAMVAQFRALANNPDLPVILLTGLSDQEMAIEAMRCGVADYLPKKSISPQSLYRSIKNAVTKAEYARAERNHLLEIEAINSELTQKNREVQAFYQSVSHELKTPLTAIREYTSLVVDGIAGEISAEAREYLTTSIECTDRLARLVNDLFDAVRIETGKLTLRKDSADIVEIARQAMALLETQRVAYGIEWALSVNTSPPPFQFDGDRVMQVFTNLLTNALKFTPAGGRIDVRIDWLSIDQQIKVSIKDTGRGIADSDIRRVFDRMFQTTVADSVNHSGMGIGLHLCKAIVDVHGGAIWVDSQVGQGSDFQFTLPCAD